MVNYIAVKIERATKEIREDLTKTKERLSNLEMDKLNEIKTRIGELEETVELNAIDFRNHEHSKKTGLPRVPP
jgi:hypothetical protein